VALLRDDAKTTGGLPLFAPLDLVFSEHNVVQPDVVFFSCERRHLVKDSEVTRAAPNLAVEVLSESSADDPRPGVHYRPDVCRPTILVVGVNGRVTERFPRAPGAPS
jgi:Uma2 family endonuclease